MAATYKARKRVFVKVDKETGKKHTTVKWYADIYFGKHAKPKRTMLLAGLEKDDADGLGTKTCFEFNQRRGGVYVAASLPLEKMVDEFCSRKVDRAGKPIKENTHEHNREQLEKWISGADVSSLEEGANTDKIVAWVGTMRANGNVDGTVNINLRVLKAFFNFCIAKEWLEKNPVPSKLMTTYHSSGHYYTPDERKKLLSPVQPHDGQKLQENEVKADKLIILATRIAQIQGIRLSQIWSLKLKDYNSSTNKLFTIGIKRKLDKAVVCHHKTLEYLREAANLNESAPDERVFKNWGSPEAMGHAFYMKRKAVGLTKGRFHDNKHTAVSEMRQQGYDPVDIEKITNTDRMTIAKVYTHADEERLQQKFDKFNVDGV